MNLNEFLQNEETWKKNNMIILLKNLDDFYFLKNYYLKQTENKIVRFNEFVTEKNFCPPASTVFEKLEKKVKDININGEKAIIVGMDFYSSLLSDEQRDIVFAILQKYLDSQVFSLSFLAFEINLIQIDNVLKNPKYESGWKLIKIDGDNTFQNSPTRYLVASQWFSEIPPDVNSFGEYIEKCGNGSFSYSMPAKVKIAIESKIMIGGIKDEIKQILTIRDYLKEFCDIDDDKLSESALELIHQKGLNALKESLLGKGKNILTTFYRCNQTEREIFLYLLRKNAAEGTFEKYLSEYDCDNFLDMFICVPENIMKKENSSDLAEQRKIVLKNFDGDWAYKLPSFIKQIKELPNEKVIPWLNNGIKEEKIELLRRYANASNTDKRKIESLYPEIADYLSCYSSDETYSYFKGYKEYKLKGEVGKLFLGHKAFTEDIPSDVKSRNSLIQEYRNDENTFLLVVDAMGAEYFDMLISLANKKQIGIKSKKIGYSNLPTSTEFNKIQWDKLRELQQIKELDNICHQGAELHVKKTHSENLFNEFEVISKIFKVIENKVKEQKQVLLTADHGSSYLALCAYNQGLTQTLLVPDNFEVKDWRFIKKKSENIEFCPPELKESSDGNYRCIRGYDRFPKSGGKEFEVHGGASWEEMLVPVIVFEQGTSVVAKKLEVVSKTEFIEDDDFANL